MRRNAPGKTGALAALLVSLATATVMAQEVVEDFESPAAKWNLIMRQSATNENTRVVPAGEAPADDAAGTALTAASVLAMKPDPDHPHLLMLNPVSFTREQIREAGSVRYQADVYLPPPGEPAPGVAVALVPVGHEKSYAMYRFGLLDNAETVYFSYSDGVQAGAVLYKNQDATELPLRRPGWNRFQVLALQNGAFVCGINGRPTSFSPVMETSLDNLAMGISVSSVKTSRDVYIDNLAMIPDSAMSLPEFPGTNPAPVSSAPPAGSSGAPAVRQTESQGFTWHFNTEQAWSEARDQRRPLLVYFTNPGFESHRHFRDLLETDPAISDLMKRAVLLRIDVSQKIGETNALKFEVFQVPTLVVLGPDGREKSRIALVMEQTTPTEISEALAPAIP